MKEKSFRSFLISCISLAGTCTVLAIGIQKVFMPDKSFVGVFCIIPFIMIVTLGFHFVLVKASFANPRNFIGKFVAFSGLKLMIYLVAVLIYAFTVKQEIVIFLLSFFLVYLIFTVYEISAILKFLKKSGD